MSETPKRIEKIRKIRELYDSFGPDGQDMTWEAFLAEFIDLSGPARLQRDLASIMQQKQLGRSTKVKIDKVIELN